MRYQPFLPFPAAELYSDQWEYLLIVSPSLNVTAKVMQVKEDFYAVYRQKIAIATWPHITVANFKAKEKLETLLIKLMQGACSEHRKFVTTLRDFGGFEPSAIFIKVQEHLPFLQLADRLYVINDCLRANGCPMASLVTHPHLTIARRLSYRIYKKAIREYLGRSFRDAFVVNKLLLLKRRHQNDKCKRVTTLSLSPDYSLN